MSGFLGVKLVCYDGVRCKLAVHNGKNYQMTPLRITSGVAYIAAEFQTVSISINATWKSDYFVC